LLPDNGWIKAAGKMSFPEENGTLQAVLKVDRATVAEAPAEDKFLRN
jgi:hypothetical protein